MGEQAPWRPPGLAYWLIVRNENGRIGVLTLDCEKTLPVFSHEEEAEMFLRLWGMGDDWRISERGAGELVSVLNRPCAGVKEVAFDPLPEMVAEKTVELVSLDRERFIERIAARRRPSGSASRVGDRRCARASGVGGARQTTASPPSLPNTPQGASHNLGTILTLLGILALLLPFLGEASAAPGAQDGSAHP